MKIYTIITILLAAALLARGAETDPDGPEASAGDDGFIPLFNGKSLDGWINVNCAPSTWTVADGMIHCTGKPTGALRTARQYENFILELEWRHLKPGGNAGVFIWAGPIAVRGVPFLRSIEVQVLDHAYGESDSFTTHGDVFPIHGSTMKPFPPSKGQRSFPSEKRSHGSPEWNHYRITCNDGTLTLAVNGKDVSGGDGCVYRKGYIALESEGGVVDYRNLRIKELPSTDPNPAETAPLAQGHRPLYNGIDLAGWEADEAAREAWKPGDWRLVYQGEGSGSLRTADSFGDVEIIFDWRFPTAAVDLEAPGPRGEPSSRAILIPTPNMGDKAWHRTTLTLFGNQLTSRIDDGPTVAEAVPDGHPAEGPIELLPPASGVEFANIYLRPLEAPVEAGELKSPESLQVPSGGS